MGYLLCRLGTHDGNGCAQMTYCMPLVRTLFMKITRRLLSQIVGRSLLILKSRPSVRTKIVLYLKLGDNTGLFGILRHFPI